MDTQPIVGDEEVQREAEVDCPSFSPKGSPTKEGSSSEGGTNPDMIIYQKPISCG